MEYIKFLVLETIKKIFIKQLVLSNSMNGRLTFIEYLKILEPSDWSRKINDKWTVKDVVAHLIGWDKGDPEIIRTTWETKKAPWFTKTKDFKEFNAKNVEFYKDYKSAELIKEWKKWKKKVREEIDKIGEEKLRKHPELFGWLFEKGGNKHEKFHYNQIKEVVKRKNLK